MRMYAYVLMRARVYTYIFKGGRGRRRGRGQGQEARAAPTGSTAHDTASGASDKAGSVCKLGRAGIQATGARAQGGGVAVGGVAVGGVGVGGVGVGGVLVIGTTLQDFVDNQDPFANGDFRSHDFRSSVPPVSINDPNWSDATPKATPTSTKTCVPNHLLHPPLQPHPSFRPAAAAGGGNGGRRDGQGDADGFRLVKPQAIIAAGRSTCEALQPGRTTSHARLVETRRTTCCAQHADISLLNMPLFPSISLYFPEYASTELPCTTP